MREQRLLVLPTGGHSPAQSDSVGALVKVEVSQFQIARLGNLQINLRTGYNRYWKARSFHYRSFIRTHKAICRGLGKGFSAAIRSENPAASVPAR